MCAMQMFFHVHHHSLSVYVPSLYSGEMLLIGTVNMIY